MSDDADRLLVERVKRGDQKAFELLMLKYQRKIERLVARMVRDTNQIPDIVQETFIRAYRALPNFRGESQFYTWLYRIAVNTAKKALLELKRQPLPYTFSGESEDNETYMLENGLTDTATPEAALEAKEIGETVNHAIAALPEDLRQAIILREIDGLSYEEIAEAMDCPIGTVRSRIFRARETIAKKLRPQLGTNGEQRW